VLHRSTKERQNWTPRCRRAAECRQNPPRSRSGPRELLQARARAVDEIGTLAGLAHASRLLREDTRDDCSRRLMCGGSPASIRTSRRLNRDRCAVDGAVAGRLLDHILWCAERQAGLRDGRRPLDTARAMPKSAPAAHPRIRMFSGLRSR
jgi:hypothetical protein